MIALMLLGGLVLYFTIAAIATRLLVRQAESRRTKWLIGFASVFVFFLIPTWDELLGSLYFEHLCSTKAGPTIYRNVKLGAKYFDMNGRPNFLKPNGDFDESAFHNRFSYAVRSGDTSQYAPTEIRVTVHVLRDIETQQELAAITVFSNFGGWVRRYAFPHVTATSCGLSRGGFGNLVRQVFIRDPALG
jgi:hypothetical protein